MTLRSCLLVLFLLTCGCGGGGGLSGDGGPADDRAADDTPAPPTLSGCRATPAAPAVGQPVAFTALYNGPEPQTWTADFDDGHTARGPRPRHAYAEPGTYRATITVESALGADACEVALEVRPLALADTSVLRGGGRVVTGAVPALSWEGCDEVVGEAQDSEEPVRLAYAYAVVERGGERVPLDVSCIGAPEVEYAGDGGLRPFQVAGDDPGLVYAVLADQFEGDRWWDRLGVWRLATGERVYLGEVPEVAGVPGVAVPIGALVAGTSGWGSSPPGRRGLPPWPPDRDGRDFSPAECPVELNTVYFGHLGSTALDSRAREALEENVEAIGTCLEACVLVTGTSYYNEADGMRVAEQRAEAVREYYVASGTDLDVLFAEAAVLGHGEAEKSGYTPTLGNLRTESRLVGCPVAR